MCYGLCTGNVDTIQSCSLDLQVELQASYTEPESRLAGRCLMWVQHVPIVDYHTGGNPWDLLPQCAPDNLAVTIVIFLPPLHRANILDLFFACTASIDTEWVYLITYIHMYTLMYAHVHVSEKGVTSLSPAFLTRSLLPSYCMIQIAAKLMVG